MKTVTSKSLKACKYPLLVLSKLRHLIITDFFIFIEIHRYKYEAEGRNVESIIDYITSTKKSNNKHGS